MDSKSEGSENGRAASERDAAYSEQPPSPPKLLEKQSVLSAGAVEIEIPPLHSPDFNQPRNSILPAIEISSASRSADSISARSHRSGANRAPSLAEIGEAYDKHLSPSKELEVNKVNHP